MDFALSLGHKYIQYLVSLKRISGGYLSKIARPKKKVLPFPAPCIWMTIPLAFGIKNQNFHGSECLPQQELINHL
jgi:hypothetical protein